MIRTCHKTLILVATLAVVTACEHTSHARVASEIKVMPVGQPTDAVRTYPTTVLNTRMAPQMTKTQRAWIDQVMRSKTYGNLSLRFAVVPGVKTLIVVYIDRPFEGGIR